MIRITLSTAFLLSTAFTAFAGPVDVPPPLPPVVIADEPFEGFYVGLEYGFAQGDITREDLLTAPVPLTFEPDGSVWGGFAGYNVQNGSLIYGGEVRLLHFDGVSEGVFEFEDVLDIRARVGFAASDALMIYGALGYSTASAVAGGVDVDLDGFNYGAGVEYNLTESWFVGADVTGRQVDGETPFFSYDGTLNTATLRVGFRF